jgi:nucleotide-binding universal stress UspA family protein
VAVLTVWEGLAEILARTGSDLGVTDVDLREVDTASENSAKQLAQEGVELAMATGLRAEAHTRRRDSTTWEAILDAADELGANAILLGTRGLSGLRSLMAGSVSGSVLHHSDRPVIIVPSPEVAARRAARRRGA